MLSSLIRFSRLIKIPGKNWFDELTSAEAALMIDAFLYDGNEYFDPLAFNDFLHAKLKNEELLRLQQELNENAFLAAAPGEWPHINREYLVDVSKRLRRE